MLYLLIGIACQELPLCFLDFPNIYNAYFACSFKSSQMFGGIISAPAANKETVLVCNTCHALLTGPVEGSGAQVQKIGGDSS